MKGMKRLLLTLTTVSATSTLITSSTDNIAVSSVAFYYGSFGGTLASSTLIGSISSPTGTLYSILWNTRTASNGSTTLWALSTDTSNNTTSASTTLNVENPPVISAVTSSTGLTTSTITWTTDEAASSQVNYGLTGSYGFSTSTAALVTSHSLTLANLIPSSTYQFQVLSTDSNGNTATTTNSAFTTRIDNVPPSVPTSVAANAVSASEVDISWGASTDNAAVAGYTIYRNGIQIATTTALTYADASLTAATTYGYALSAFDASGNASAQSSAATATTQNAGSSGQALPTVEVAAGYKVGLPPGYILLPTSTPTGTAIGSPSVADMEATITSLRRQLLALLMELLLILRTRL